MIDNRAGLMIDANGEALNKTLYVIGEMKNVPKKVIIETLDFSFSTLSGVACVSMALGGIVLVLL